LERGLATLECAFHLLYFPFSNPLQI